MKLKKRIGASSLAVVLAVCMVLALLPLSQTDAANESDVQTISTAASASSVSHVTVHDPSVVKGYVKESEYGGCLVQLRRLWEKRMIPTRKRCISSSAPIWHGLIHGI